MEDTTFPRIFFDPQIVEFVVLECTVLRVTSVVKNGFGVAGSQCTPLGQPPCDVCLPRGPC